MPPLKFHFLSWNTNYVSGGVLLRPMWPKDKVEDMLLVGNG